jgi:hypothetical protein
MAVCCQNLPPGALSSRSAPSVLVGELFKKFGLFLIACVLRCYLEEHVRLSWTLQLVLKHVFHRDYFPILFINTTVSAYEF